MKVLRDGNQLPKAMYRGAIVKLYEYWPEQNSVLTDRGMIPVDCLTKIQRPSILDEAIYLAIGVKG